MGKYTLGKPAPVPDHVLKDCPATEFRVRKLENGEYECRLYRAAPNGFPTSLAQECWTASYKDTPVIMAAFLRELEQ